MNEALKDRLKGLSDKEIHAMLMANSLGYWCEATRPILDGAAFTFDKHEYLRDLYYDANPRIVIRKAAQMGYSTFGILRAIHGCTFIYPKGVLYLFPNKDEVTDFSKTRFKRFLEENPVLAPTIKDTDTAHVKQINQGFLYLRGSRTRTGLKSIPVDDITYDEYDEMEQTMIDLAGHRTDHSDIQSWLKLSTPTIPGELIDQEYERSDQKHWYLKCDHCGEGTCLENDFPRYIQIINKQWMRVCRNCDRPIQLGNGQWVKENLNSDISGYYISQLNSAYVNLETRMEQYRRGENLRELHNSFLGLAYLDAAHEISREEVLALCGSSVMRISEQAPCCMGVDTGKNMHVIIAKKKTETLAEVVYVGTHREWEKLHNLMYDFNVVSCVIDGQPETQNARDFANKHRGRVFLRMGYAIQTMGHLKWDYSDYTVKGNRTETLDNSHNAILGRIVILPRRSRDIEELADHCTAIAKVMIEDMETGEKKPIWKKKSNREDHYRHAFNFMWMAYQRIKYISARETPETEETGLIPLDEVAGY